MLKLAIVIVSFNTKALLRRCLDSIFTSAELSAERLKIEVIVVDSASHDGSPEMVAAGFPQVNLQAQSENIGFTRGNNLALKLLGFPLAPSSPRPLPPPSFYPDFVLLLNPDTEILGDALYQMANFLQENPTVGACGSRLQYGDGIFQHGAFQFPSLFQTALDFFPLIGVPGANRLHNSRLNGRYPTNLWNDTTPFLVDFVLGATLMVCAEAIAQVGGLDEDYFMYCEEMDWCLRLGDAGWPVYVVPTARVIHHEGQSSRQIRWEAYLWLWQSRFRFYEKHRHRYPVGYLTAVRLILRSGLQKRSRQAHRLFVKGEITGIQLSEELAAYQKVRQLL